VSRNQKAPLLAFVLVALVCGLILVDTMRGNAYDDQFRALPPDALGPAYFMAPEPPPIGPVDEADGLIEASEAPTSVAEGVSGTPDSIDEGTEGPRGDHVAGPIGHNGGTHPQGTTPTDAASHPTDGDDTSDEGELWPPSTVPGIKNPIVIFTIIFGPDQVPSEEPTEQPSEEPTTESGDNQVESEGSGGSESPADPDQGDPADDSTGETLPPEPLGAP
jgi:hypothetical protein